MAEQDNSMIGKSWLSRLAFITLVIIIFFIFLRIGTFVLTAINSPNKTPVLINGMADGKMKKKIDVNPNKINSVPIYRSDNEDKGMEFTWSVWINISEDDIPADGSMRKKHIFNKGNVTQNLGKDYFDVNGPGLYLNYEESALNKTVDIHILMDTFQDIAVKGDTTIEVKSLSFNKWINIIVRGEHDTLDVFIDGILVKRQVFSDIFEQNYGHVYVSSALEDSGGVAETGFNGKLSALTYYDKAIGTSKILELQNMGPNLTYLGSEDYENTIGTYLSQIWYSTQLQT